MKRVLMMVALGLLLALSVYAGQIYGSLKEDGRAVQARTHLHMDCNGRSYDAYTDDYGAYSIGAEKGKCALMVEYKGQIVALDLYAYDDPVRYDFDLVLENGKYSLRRK